MSSILAPFRAPQCSSCLRRMTAGFGQSVLGHSRQQVRGKKTVPKETTVKVRLLRDVGRYGKKGAVVPVMTGKMRNDFLPRGKAEYVTKEQIKELGLVGAVIERDYTFGEKVWTKSTKDDEVAEERRLEVKVELLKPERAVKVLEMLLPANLDFYRTPISTPAPPTPAPRLSPSIPSTSRLSEEAETSAQQPGTDAQSQKAAIYGSVTNVDIAANLRAILAEDEEGARVVLGSEEVEFVEQLEEADRVKHLGVYEIEIRLKGGQLPVRRTIKVNAQE